MARLLLSHANGMPVDMPSVLTQFHMCHVYASADENMSRAMRPYTGCSCRVSPCAASHGAVTLASSACLGRCRAARVSKSWHILAAPDRVSCGSRRADRPPAHIWPTHRVNVHVYGIHSVDIDGDLAKLDADGYRPLRLAGD